MIRMTWIRVEGVGVLRSFLPSFVSPSFLPSLIPFCLGIPSFLRGFSIRSLLSCLLPFLLLPSFLPSFLSSFPFRSFVSSSFLFCFLFFSFLPSFLSPGIPSFPPCLRRDLPSKKRTEKIHPPLRNLFPWYHSDSSLQKLIAAWELFGQLALLWCVALLIPAAHHPIHFLSRCDNSRSTVRRTDG